VHFDRAFVPPEAIGHRALAVNLSDLAAMGATPRLALLSLVLPATLPVSDFDGIVAGLAALARRYGLHVAGGNLTRSPGPLIVDVTVAGTVKRRRALLRRGARAGDELYVSGSIGAAAAGLQMLNNGLRNGAQGLAGSAGDALNVESCIGRYLYPEPRVRLGSLLGRNRAASACMDVSDGLADAVWRMAEASGVGATIDADTLPLDPEARGWFASRGGDAAYEAITHSDDYELLVAVRPKAPGRLRAARRYGNVPLTLIGRCTADRAVVWRRSVGGVATETSLPRGYSHFR